MTPLSQPNWTRKSRAVSSVSIACPFSSSTQSRMWRASIILNWNSKEIFCLNSFCIFSYKLLLHKVMFIKYTKPRRKWRYTLETETKVHFQHIQKFSFTRMILENFHAFETISLVSKNKNEKAFSFKGSAKNVKSYRYLITT